MERNIESSTERRGDRAQPSTATAPTFIERILAHLEAHPAKALVVEMHGRTEIPTPNRDTVERIARARGALRAAGVRPGDRVVLLAPNSSRWVAADLAILAEGAVTVPLYARQAGAELVAMIEDCEPAAIVVADEELESTVGSAGASFRRIRLDALFDGDAIATAPHPRAADDVVTIIYTSGTSGVAKGVETTAGNVDYMLPVVCDALDRLMGRRAADDRVFHYLPFCFAGSRVVLWTCLFRNVPIRMSTSLEDLEGEMAGARPHYFLNVPALLERIKNGVEDNIARQGRAVRALYERAKRAHLRDAHGEARLTDEMVLTAARGVVFRKIRERIGEDLECLICGSAPLGEETQRWFEMLGIPVYQVYGLTETTAIVTMDEPRAATAGRVGHAIAGCETRIADDGELQIRGPNVFPGYFRREQETRDAFTDDGWFRTGDAAEIDARGNFRIIGRTKNVLVPTSGHNVAPEPIEQSLVEGIRGAAHAVVFGHGKPFLSAVVSGDVTDADVERRVEDLNATAPHYKRIRAWRATSAPFTPENGLLTANQKLKRKALEAFFAREIEEMYR